MSEVPACFAAPDDALRAAWKGRDDGPADDLRRWHQVVRQCDLCDDAALAASIDDAARAFVLVGYATDRGIARNGGRDGAADGPHQLRLRMASLAAVEGAVILDAGDVRPAASVAESQEALAWAVERIVRAGATPIVLGGGHDQAFGQFLGVARARGTPPACVNFDAHLDLREIPSDGPNSGTPFTQAWEWCRAKRAPFRYAALGVQRMSNTQRLFDRAEMAGATVVDADGFALDTIDVVMDAVSDAVDGADIALSIDLDVFAAAFAPGVSAPTALGIAPDAAFRRVLRGLFASGAVASVEIAELCPRLDVDSRTARLGASLVYEAVSALSARATEESGSGA